MTVFNKVTSLRELGAMQEQMGKVLDYGEDRKESRAKTSPSSKKAQKDDIEVNITQDFITISGQKKEEEKLEKKDFYSLERSFGTFIRKLRLPEGGQTDKVKASFMDGVLEARIPKSPTAEAKKIPID